MTQYAVSFGEAIKRYWTDNWTVKGRASRSEFWKGALGNGILLSIASYVIAYAITAMGMLELLMAYQTILGLATTWIGMILTMRRLHDIGKSGWWIWINFIPLIGAILLLIWTCRASEPAENQYGPIPNVK
jgi:uncharacterized membrane protein YhaH (DUF805 family)